MNKSTEQAAPNARITWYRTPLDKETMRDLNAKSDLKGFAQCLGHLGLRILCGGAAVYGVGRWYWWVIALLVFANGTIAAFSINAVHELVHKSVFKTQWLNGFFARIFAFFGWTNHEHFYASHMRHHQYTLHQPDDLEVVLPMRVLVRHFFQQGFVRVDALPMFTREAFRHARGKFNGPWEATILPEAEVEVRRAVVSWARILVAGHAAILALSLAAGLLLDARWFLLPLLTSLTPFYGIWLQFICNNTQHIGLQDGVPDFRLCCRTFTVNPFFQFLYWHMNYHIEHHMYAAVPCYNLPKLHRAIKHELPPCTHGLIATWKEIAAIQKQQDENPDYQYVAPLPSPHSMSEPSRSSQTAAFSPQHADAAS